jgi:hypothetical protein
VQEYECSGDMMASSLPPDTAYSPTHPLSLPLTYDQMKYRSPDQLARLTDSAS